MSAYARILAAAVACLAPAALAQTATPAPSAAEAVTASPSPEVRIRVKLDKDSGEPIAVRDGRAYTSVDELKAYVAGLPRGTRVRYNPWLGPDNRHHKFLYPAIKELKDVCGEHGLSLSVSIEPYW